MKSIIVFFCIVFLFVFTISSCSKKLSVSEPEPEIGTVNDGDIPTPMATVEMLPSASYAPGSKWGVLGTEDGNFNNPQSLAVDSQDNIYVVDKGNNRVRKFNSSGTFLKKWGSAGSGNGEFNAPDGIALDTNNNVYVVDTGNNRIQVFNSDGVYQAQWGTSGSGNGQFNGPVDVAIDGNNIVYVTDGNNARIQKFMTDGTFIEEWKSAVSGHPYYTAGNIRVAINKSNNYVYVSNNASHIYVFTPDGNLSVNPVWIGWALNVGCESTGIIIRLDSFNIDFIGLDGNRVAYIQSNTWPDINEPFHGLRDIVFDNQGNLYVTDYYTGFNTNRVVKYNKILTQ
ncbi:MAG: 6-bladed beta-propeller [Candidatus Goldbacteria bacterium]|nr:6-bladed beta-propeller [Candidatus Goldiibacteriota bacterium]